MPRKVYLKRGPETSLGVGSDGGIRIGTVKGASLSESRMLAIETAEMVGKDAVESVIANDIWPMPLGYVNTGQWPRNQKDYVDWGRQLQNQKEESAEDEWSSQDELAVPTQYQWLHLLMQAQKAYGSDTTLHPTSRIGNLYQKAVYGEINAMSPQTVLGAGRVDPFESFPIKGQAFVHDLVDHCKLSLSSYSHIL